MDSGSRQKEKLSVDADFVCVLPRATPVGCASSFPELQDGLDD